MMTQEELTEHVKRKSRSGYPAGELRLELLQEGYAETDVDSAFITASSRKKMYKPLWYLMSIAFILIGLTRYLNGNKLWGMILICWGLVSIIAKLAMTFREDESY